MVKLKSPGSRAPGAFVYLVLWSVPLSCPKPPPTRMFIIIFELIFFISLKSSNFPPVFMETARGFMCVSWVVGPYLWEGLPFGRVDFIEWLQCELLHHLKLAFLRPKPKGYLSYWVPFLKFLSNILCYNNGLRYVGVTINWLGNWRNLCSYAKQLKYSIGELSPDIMNSAQIFLSRIFKSMQLLSDRYCFNKTRTMFVCSACFMQSVE